MTIALEAREVTLRYPARGLRSGTGVLAVDGVSLSVAHGETVAIVGESGSGKTTLARLLLGLEKPDSGQVRFDGTEISDLPEARVRPLRRRFQPVFQDPYASLNPRLRVETILSEPLLAHRLGGSRLRRDRVHELLELVGLPRDAALRFPTEFSGGERQRIAIARALATGPELLVLDEPVSALDPSVRTQILSLLARLEHTLNLTLVLISHDLTLVEGLADRVAVMFTGRFVEEGPVQDLFREPAHPYTRLLLAAADAVRGQGKLEGEHPPAVGRPWTGSSCRFASRCGVATERCRSEPELLPVGSEGHRVACWLVEGGRGAPHVRGA